ncbi:MAG: DNA methyltransferase, partial [Thaumarchaeota archaeon]|nr:DNA methyltransferase [Nitrososphaerota archaeon]
TGDKHTRCNGNGIHKYSFWNSVDYYFHLNAIREKSITQSKSLNLRVRENITGKAQQKMGDFAWTASDEEMDKYNKDGTKKQDNTLGADGKPKATYAGFNERWKDRKYQEQEINRVNSGGFNNITGESLNHPSGKNPGDVFFINPKPFTEAHFATFPIELPEYILKCACPQQVCSKCDMPRYPISKPTEQYSKLLDKSWNDHKSTLQEGHKKDCVSATAEYKTIGYTKCDCNEKFIPGICLDPFMGAGTTAVAAEQAGLRWCGIELKEEYSKIAKERLEPYLRQERME